MQVGTISSLYGRETDSLVSRIIHGGRRTCQWYSLAEITPTVDYVLAYQRRDYFTRNHAS